MKGTYGDLGVHGRDERLTSRVKAHQLSRGQHCYSDVRWDFFLCCLLERQDNPSLHVRKRRDHRVSGLLRGERVGEVDATQQPFLARKIGFDTTLKTKT